jgi:hypothetical protein
MVFVLCFRKACLGKARFKWPATETEQEVCQSDESSIFACLLPIFYRQQQGIDLNRCIGIMRAPNWFKSYNKKLYNHKYKVFN